jgi:hypothetical protein
MRSTIFALACALLAFAPALPAQAAPVSTPLTPHVGSPIAYRVQLPKGWNIQQEGEFLGAATGDAMVAVAASDVMAGEESGLPVGEAEARRIMSNMILGSDSLMFAMLNEMLKGFQEDGSELQDVVREVRTFAGERSGYLSGRSMDLLDKPARVEVHFTIKDGVVYALVFAATEARFAAYQPLFARVRDSFAFPAAPPAPGGKGKP